MTGANLFPKTCVFGGSCPASVNMLYMCFRAYPPLNLEIWAETVVIARYMYSVNDNIWTGTYVKLVLTFLFKFQSVLLKSICLAYLHCHDYTRRQTRKGHLPRSPCRESNLPTPACKSGALPIELSGLTVLSKVRYFTSKKTHRATNLSGFISITYEL